MNEPKTVVGAFQRLQAGDALGALEIAHAIAAEQPGNARARLVAGIALRGLGRFDEAKAALEAAAALDARDYAPAYELGLLHDRRGDAAAALAHFERAATLKPAFAPAQYAAGMNRLARKEWDVALGRFDAVLQLDARNAEAHAARAQALHGAGRLVEAEESFRRAIAIDPGHLFSLRTLGRYGVNRGDFAEAARFFGAALVRDPADAALPVFLAQAELLLGRWEAGWAAYRRRETRVEFEAARQREAKPYRVPGKDEIAGRPVLLVAEQGLGDILFFLRFAPMLRAASRLAFAGDARLHPLLACTGLFEELAVDRGALSGRYDVELLTGDLPVFARSGEPTPGSLRIEPDAERMRRWSEKLGKLGPHPWTGATWRAGTPGDVLANGLYKAAPIEALFAALKPAGGTVVAIQRKPAADELAQAAHALGAPVHDFSAMNDDLEDALALLAVLDRHVGVSNTNMHLAALAGKTARVLMPFPPEWRWGIAGASPWYPGFEVFRQLPGGDWKPALAALAASGKN
jgi:tetratricopeptide (TPR) repeat protein